MISRRQLLQLPLVGGLLPNGFSAEAATILRNGIDISWLPIFEDAGGKYYNSSGKVTEAFALMKANGVSVVRIRVFVNPSYRNGRLSDALNLAQRAKNAGIDVCLDLHFSDDWADPGKQNIPASWSNSNVQLLASQLNAYVTNTLNEFKSRNLPLAYVQLGNEITNGMLWPLGKISSNDQYQWKNLATLYNSAVAALRSTLPSAKNLLHLDAGGDAKRIRWWLMQASQYWIRDFNVVGLSYYPQWHGPLKGLQETLDMVAWEFNKPVVIAETAYPWTTTRFGGDVLDPYTSTLSGYPATPSGQSAYLKKLNSIVKSLYGGNGIGVWWWEGLAGRVSSNGRVIWDSGMTNSTLVSDVDKALPALAAIKG